MTLKEFEKKYDIPYNIIYAATPYVRSTSTTMVDRDYPEKELMDAIVHNLAISLDRHKRYLEKYSEMLNRLHMK